MNEYENYSIGAREKAVLRETRVFRGLDDVAFEAALRRGMARGARYEKGAVISGHWERRNEFMTLIEGRAQGVHEHSDGSSDFVQLFVPGEVCGLDIVCSASRRCPFMMIALDDVDIVFINYDGMFSGKPPRIVEKYLREGVSQTLATESLRRLHKIDVLYRRALRERISVYFRNLCEIKGSNKVELNMDREQFAQYLGVNRSALSHELSCMRDDGLIAFRKSKFEVLFDDFKR